MKTIEQQISNRCVHFTGVQKKTCKAGVEYSRFFGSPFPCFRDESEKAKAHCDLVRFPTEQEVTAEVEGQLVRHCRAVKAAHQDAKSKGLVRGKGGQSELACPVCETGIIKYSVASVNGHMWARCSTKDCVRWAE